MLGRYARSLPNFTFMPASSMSLKTLSFMCPLGRARWMSGADPSTGLAAAMLGALRQRVRRKAEAYSPSWGWKTAGRWSVRLEALGVEWEVLLRTNCAMR